MIERGLVESTLLCGMDRFVGCIRWVLGDRLVEHSQDRAMIETRIVGCPPRLDIATGNRGNQCGTMIG